MDLDEPNNLQTPRNSLSLFRINKLKDLEKTNIHLNERINELEKLCALLKQENDKLKEYLENSTINNLTNKNGVSDSRTQLNNESAQDIEPQVEELNHETAWILKKRKKSNNKTKKVIAPPEPTLQRPTYETDEEELARETDWITKRRKNNQKKTVKVYTAPESAHNTDIPVQKNIKPPPIIITDVEEYQDLNIKLKSLAKNLFYVTMLRGGSYKISTVADDDYRNITKFLNQNEMSWYSYQYNESKPIRVMAKYLHKSNDPIDIVNDLKDQGFKVLEVGKKFSFNKKEQLNMFTITFDTTEDINKINKIKYILNTVVKIEPVRQEKLIAQCKKCQGYGHTKNYCNKAPRCVKCCGKHKSADCQLPENAQPKCCNCGKEHPASYRGCIVAKELQKLRNKKFNRNIRNTTPVKTTYQPEFSNMAMTSKETNVKISSKSYADTLRANTPSSNKKTDILTEILSKISEQHIFLRNIDQRLSILEESTIQNE